jgi:hypothetical protein
MRETGDLTNAVLEYDRRPAGREAIDHTTFDALTNSSSVGKTTKTLDISASNEP